MWSASANRNPAGPPRSTSLGSSARPASRYPWFSWLAPGDEPNLLALMEQSLRLEVAIAASATIDGSHRHDGRFRGGGGRGQLERRRTAARPLSRGDHARNRSPRGARRDKAAPPHESSRSAHGSGRTLSRDLPPNPGRPRGGRPSRGGGARRSAWDAHHYRATDLRAALRPTSRRRVSRILSDGQ